MPNPRVPADATGLPAADPSLDPSCGTGASNELEALRRVRRGSVHGPQGGPGKAGYDADVPLLTGAEALQIVEQLQTIRCRAEVIGWAIRGAAAVLGADPELGAIAWGADDIVDDLKKLAEEIELREMGARRT